MPEVAVAQVEPRYNPIAPYHPAENYPEYPFGNDDVAPGNPAYAAVRECFRLLGLDAEHADGKGWNPLGSIVQPGDTVVLKPNFVTHRHADGGDVFSIITHPSVIRAVADYVVIALRGHGRIVVADSPQMDCDFDALLARTGLPVVASFYRGHGVDFGVQDLRSFQLIDPDEPAYAANRRLLSGDPQGSVTIDLGSASRLAALDDGRYYGADFDRTVTNDRHSGGHHRYDVSATVMRADVVISIPKLKVHKKVGTTLNIKGLVGVTTDKNSLVHYRVGTPREGGDQLPDQMQSSQKLLTRIKGALFDRLLARQDRAGDFVFAAALRMYRVFVKPLLPRQDTENRQMLDAGNWHGNDTAWRMAADLYKVVHEYDGAGLPSSRPPRKFFCVVDGIIGGEGNGPLVPTARAAGVVVAGADLLAVDTAASRLMGFAPGRIPLLANLAGKDSFAPPVIRAGAEEIRTMFQHSGRLLGFAPHPGWRDHLELEEKKS